MKFKTSEESKKQLIQNIINKDLARQSEMAIILEIIKLAIIDCECDLSWNVILKFPLDSKMYDLVLRNREFLEMLGYYVPKNSGEIRIEI